MNIFKNIVLVCYIIVCILLILVTTFQKKDDAESIDDTYENPNMNKYFNKNKSRTKMGRAQKHTIILGIAFAILTILTSITYVVIK